MSDKARELLERALICIDAGNPICVGKDVLSEAIRAYLAKPEVKREALSEDEIGEGYRTSNGVEKFFDFYLGVRFAEKHHRIGDGDK